ncbi:MAG: methionine--tRNA ligase [Chloroflexi bacterium]|nr:methionine--tRNA ligase [Chloroflexota bacterium]
MPERIFIGVAWPYPNGPLHLGHIAGAYLPADIFARYHRVKGNEVLMVSGSDAHGTPVTVLADKESRTPQEIFERYHASFLRSFRGLGISFDIFTHTDTPNHAQTARDIFLKLYERGHFLKQRTRQLYSPTLNMFLPDRYVEGTCPRCGFARARGDQCDKCGSLLDPLDLKEPRCKLDGSVPEVRETDHLFLRLGDFEERLKAWVRKQTHWRSNVHRFTLGYLEEGLKPRAMTRDLAWGIPVPVAGFDGKCIYVWFEAVIGYLSASKQYFQERGDPEGWRRFWQGPEVKSYYFIGKDNIPFHTIIWPAILMGYGGLNLPYDVPANEYLTLEGRKLSTSEAWAVWVPDYLERYDPDPLRYTLSVTMPESGDLDFTWKEFVRRNNDELVATYGNLVNRVLTFTYRNFDRRVPRPAHLDARDQALLAKAKHTLQAVDKALAHTSFREAVREAFSLAQEGNRYLEDLAPWKTLREDPQRTATTLWVALYAIAALKTVLGPFLPFSSEKLHHFLGLEGTAAGAGWAIQEPVPGRPLREPAALFKKLEEQVALDERARLEAARVGG